MTDLSTMPDLNTITPYDAYHHACDVLNGRWPDAELEAEPLFMTNPCWAYIHARYIKEAPSPEAESVIKDSIWWDDYATYFNIKE